MRRPDSNSSLLRLRRNKWLSAKSAARAETCHSGASAAKADSTVSPYVAAKAATHKHSRSRPNIFLIGKGPRRGSCAMRHFIRLQRQVRLRYYRRATSRRTLMLLASRFQFSQNGDSCLAQNTLDHVVCQTRCVVIKMEEIFFLVIAKFLKTVSVGELAQRAKVLRLEPFLQFVGSSH
jgi:hypothetical protein